MNIQTKTMGTVEIDERQKVQFPEGLFGFESMTDFALIDAEEKPFVWLQSLQDSTLAFLLVDPFLFCDYEADVSDSELAKIGVRDVSEILLFAIVTIPRDGSAVTANLQGPVVLNKTNRKAVQLIVDDPRWKTKHSIVEELRKKGGKKC